MIFRYFGSCLVFYDLIDLVKYMCRSPNSMAWPITLFGCVAAGLRCTLANSSYTPPELAHQLSDSRAGYVFVHPALLPTLFKAFEVLKVPAKEAQKRVSDTPRAPRVHDTEENLLGYCNELQRTYPQRSRVLRQFDSLLKCGKLEAEERFDGELADETVYLCYSSGTTGLSKGVEVSSITFVIELDLILAARQHTTTSTLSSRFAVPRSLG